MAAGVTIRSLVVPFAEELLRRDLPALPDDRRDRAIDFSIGRIRTMPSPTRAGALTVAAIVRLAIATAGADRVVGAMTKLVLPGFGEYVRLIRSLGYAFVFETWPSTAPDGAPG